MRRVNYSEPRNIFRPASRIGWVKNLSVKHESFGFVFLRPFTNGIFLVVDFYMGATANWPQIDNSCDENTMLSLCRPRFGLTWGES